jgi:hypothetical protein
MHEPDASVVHFARWRPFAQNAVSRSAVSSPAREEEGGAREAADTIARSCARGEQLPEAAE